MDGYNAYEVACKILLNEKRVKKLMETPRHKRYEKRENYITATCRELKVKLSEEEREIARMEIRKILKDY